MLNTTSAPGHAHAIGSRVRVQFDASGGRRAGWRSAVVVAQTGLTSEYSYPSPTYVVRLRDGRTVANCAAECVRGAL